MSIAGMSPRLEADRRSDFDEAEVPTTSAYWENVEFALNMLTHYRASNALPPKSFDFSVLAKGVRDEFSMHRCFELFQEVMVFLACAQVFDASRNAFGQSQEDLRFNMPRFSSARAGEAALDALINSNRGTPVTPGAIAAAMLTRVTGNVVSTAIKAGLGEYERAVTYRSVFNLQERKELFRTALERAFPEDAGGTRIANNIRKLNLPLHNENLYSQLFQDAVERRTHIYASRPKQALFDVFPERKAKIKKELEAAIEDFPQSTVDAFNEWINPCLDDNLSVLFLVSAASGTGKTQLAETIARTILGIDTEKIRKVTIDDLSSRQFFEGISPNWSALHLGEDIHKVAGIHQSEVMAQDHCDVVALADDIRGVEDKKEIQELLKNLNTESHSYVNNGLTYEKRLKLIITANYKDLIEIRGVKLRTRTVEVKNGRTNFINSMNRAVDRLLNNQKSTHDDSFCEGVLAKFNEYVEVMVQAAELTGGTMGDVKKIAVNLWHHLASNREHGLTDHPDDTLVTLVGQLNALHEKQEEELDADQLRDVVQALKPLLASRLNPEAAVFVPQGWPA